MLDVCGGGLLYDRMVDCVALVGEKMSCGKSKNNGLENAMSKEKTKRKKKTKHTHTHTNQGVYENREPTGTPPPPRTPPPRTNKHRCSTRMRLLRVVGPQESCESIETETNGPVNVTADVAIVTDSPTEAGQSIETKTIAAVNAPDNATFTVDIADSPNDKLCRICLETSGELHQVCLCRGTTKWIHIHCAQRWIEIGRKKNPKNGYQCEICHGDYDKNLLMVTKPRDYKFLNFFITRWCDFFGCLFSVFVAYGVQFCGKESHEFVFLSVLFAIITTLGYSALVIFKSAALNSEINTEIVVDMIFWFAIWHTLFALWSSYLQIWSNLQDINYERNVNVEFLWVYVATLWLVATVVACCSRS